MAIVREEVSGIEVEKGQKTYGKQDEHRRCDVDHERVDLVGVDNSYAKAACHDCEREKRGSG